MWLMGIASRFQANLREDYWKAMKNILNYLKRTRDIFFIYDGSDLKLKGFIDFSFQSNLNDSKFISGYVFTMYGGAVS